MLGKGGGGISVLQTSIFKMKVIFVHYDMKIDTFVGTTLYNMNNDTL